MSLGMKTKREIYQAHFRRYQQAGKTEKGTILDEPAGTIGLNRDHLVHILARYGKQRKGEDEGNSRDPKARRSRRERTPGKRGGRPPKYQEGAFIGVLTRIWEDHGRPCGRKRSFRSSLRP